MNISSVVAVLLLASVAQGLYFGITAKPFCFEIDSEPGKTLKLFYEVTGDKPESTQVNLVSNNQAFSVSLTGANNKTEQSMDDTITACFISADGGYKSVSVDYYAHDKAHLMELAKKSEIYELHTKLIDVGEGLKEITKNELFEEQRQTIHAQIITDHQKTVKNYAVGKLIAIVIVAFGQLMLLKKLMEKQGYQPI